MLEAVKSPTWSTLSRKLLLTGAAFIVLLLALTLAGARPAHAATYSPAGYDYLNVQTTYAGTFSNAQPYIQWYRAGYLPPIFRGEFKDTYVYAKHPVGCIYAKVTWHTLTGSVTWPPIGSTATTSDGYWRSCRASGQSYPSYLTLNGVNYASSKLYAMTLQVCHSSTSTAPKVCSQNKYYN